jgi:hypothetical protein
MTTGSLAARAVARLRELNIGIAVDGENLRYYGPKGAVTPEMRQFMIDHKAALISFLRAEQEEAQRRIDQLAEQGVIPPDLVAAFKALEPTAVRYLTRQRTDPEPANRPKHYVRGEAK